SASWLINSSSLGSPVAAREFAASLPSPFLDGVPTPLIVITSFTGHPVCPGTTPSTRHLLREPRTKPEVTSAVHSDGTRKDPHRGQGPHRRTLTGSFGRDRATGRAPPDGRAAPG